MLLDGGNTTPFIYLEHIGDLRPPKKGAVRSNWPIREIDQFGGQLPTDWSILPNWPNRRQIGQFV